jgi:two-component system chemotaxis sensor kinase CheA
MRSVPHSTERRRSAGNLPLVPSPYGLATTWHISLRFTLNAFRHGVEPLAIVNKLHALGQECTVAIVDDRLPRFAEMDPMSCHLGFEINLLTDVPCAEIEAVFDAVREDCIVRIFPPNRRSSDLINLLNSLPEEGRLGDILVECGAISRDSLDEAIAQHKALKDGGDLPQQPMAIGEMLVEQQLVSPDTVDAALLRQSMARLPLPSGEAAGRDQELLLNQLLDRTAELCAGLNAQDPAQQYTILQIQELASEIRSVMPALNLKSRR